MSTKTTLKHRSATQGAAGYHLYEDPQGLCLQLDGIDAHLTRLNDGSTSVLVRLDRATAVELGLVAANAGEDNIENFYSHTPGPAAVVPKTAPAGTCYTGEGDTLSGVAYRELGDEARWKEIVALNPSCYDLENAHAQTPLRAGTHLTLPTAA